MSEETLQQNNSYFATSSALLLQNLSHFSYLKFFHFSGVFGFLDPFYVFSLLNFHVGEYDCLQKTKQTFRHPGSQFIYVISNCQVSEYQSLQKNTFDFPAFRWIIHLIFPLSNFHLHLPPSGKKCTLAFSYQKLVSRTLLAKTSRFQIIYWGILTHPYHPHTIASVWPGCVHSAH